MARTASKTARPAARPSRPAAPAGDRRADVTGLLLLLSTATAVCPPLLGGNAFATRGALILVAGAAWLAAWAAGLVRHGRDHVPFAAATALALAVAVASGAASAFPASNLMDGMGTSMGAVTWAALVAVALGAAGCAITGRLRLWIAGSYVWVLGSAAVALFQSLTHAAVSAGLTNSNNFGLAMLLFAPLSVGLAATSRTPRERWGWLAAGAFVAAAVVMSGARAATLALGAEAALLAVVAAPLAPARMRRALVTAGAIAAGAVVAAVIAVTVAGAAGPAGLSWLPAAAREALTTRAYLWQGAVAAFREAPILGHGTDGYLYAAQSHTQAALLRIEHGKSVLDALSSDPHSLPLRVLVDLGAAGALVLAAAAGAWAWAVARAKAPSPHAGVLRASFAAGAAGFLLGACFAPWGVALGAAPAVVIGLAASRPREADPALAPPAVPRWTAAGLVGALLIAAAGSHALEARAVALASSAGSAEAQVGWLDQGVAAAPWDASVRFLALQGRAKAAPASGGGAAFREAVGSDALVGAYAPYVADLVRYSLVEAQLTGRADLTWERRELDRAAALAPELPEVAAESIHLAVLSGDKAAIRQALAKWGRLAEPAADYAYYARTAQEALAR